MIIRARLLISRELHVSGTAGDQKKVITLGTRAGDGLAQVEGVTRILVEQMHLQMQMQLHGRAHHWPVHDHSNICSGHAVTITLQRPNQIR